MLRALFALVEPKADEMGAKSRCSTGISLLVPGTAAEESTATAAASGMEIPPCPSGALLAGCSGRVSSLFRLQSRVLASTVPTIKTPAAGHGDLVLCKNRIVLV